MTNRLIFSLTILGIIQNHTVSAAFAQSCHSSSASPSYTYTYPSSSGGYYYYPSGGGGESSGPTPAEVLQGVSLGISAGALLYGLYKNYQHNKIRNRYLLRPNSSKPVVPLIPDIRKSVTGVLVYPEDSIPYDPNTILQSNLIPLNDDKSPLILDPIDDSIPIDPILNLQQRQFTDSLPDGIRSRSPRRLKPYTGSQLQKAAGGTLQDATNFISRIQDPDKDTEVKLKAIAAMDLINTRIDTSNYGTGWIRNNLLGPLDPFRYNGKSLAERDADLEAVRNSNSKDKDLNQYAWNKQIGRCNEHASLMQHMLQGAGIKDVRYLSNDGHAFAVVNAGKNADPDNPWTWSNRAFVPDSWQGEILSDKRDIWKNPYLFNGGKQHVGDTTFTSRKQLEHIANKGPAFMTKNKDLYNKLYQQYQQIPKDIRDGLDFKPPPPPVTPQSVGKGIPTPSLKSQGSSKSRL